MFVTFIVHVRVSKAGTGSKIPDISYRHIRHRCIQKNLLDVVGMGNYKHVVEDELGTTKG